MDKFYTCHFQSKKIDLYSNNKLIATFTPTSNSVKFIARELAKCKPVG